MMRRMGTLGLSLLLVVHLQLYRKCQRFESTRSDGNGE